MWGARGWFDLTSKAALEDLYTEAAEALNTQPFLNDIIGNSFAKGCADNNADFFDMFGLGSGEAGARCKRWPARPRRRQLGQRVRRRAQG